MITLRFFNRHPVLQAIVLFLFALANVIAWGSLLLVLAGD